MLNLPILQWTKVFNLICTINFLFAPEMLSITVDRAYFKWMI